MNAIKPNEKLDVRSAPADISTRSQREANRSQDDRDELVERISQAIPTDGTIEPLKGLHFKRSSLALEPCHAVSVPAFCVIA